MKKLSLAESLFWIIGSTLLVTGGGYSGLKNYFRWQYRREHDSSYFLSRIIQTGPEKQALNTTYLAELMEMAADDPIPIAYFSPEEARKKLLASPVIKEADVKLIGPDTVYVDYTVRKPIAWLFDFENVALSEDAVPFPVSPFFTPKNLPEVYFGISRIHFGAPLKGQQVDLALALLKLCTFPVKRIDLSKAFDPSLGRREIVLITEEAGFFHFLRLSTKNFPQEIGNYLELRPQLLPKSQVIDLRIPKLGFLTQIQTPA